MEANVTAWGFKNTTATASLTPEELAPEVGIKPEVCDAFTFTKCVCVSE